VSSDIAACRETIEYVKYLFESTPYSLQLFEHSNVYSLCIGKGNQLNFDLLMFGHLDVVPAHENAFVPYYDGDWMYARGAADMKGSCAVMIQLFLDNAHNPLFDRFGLIFTTDEEVGGSDGMGYLVKECGLTAQTVFNPDAGHCFVPCVGEKGFLFAKLLAHGVTTHGSQPWLGENAIEKLIKDLGNIRNVFTYADATNEWTISMNIGTIKGGDATNKVPDYAEATIDFRYPAEMDKTVIQEKLKSSLQYCDFSFPIVADPVSIAEDNPYLQKFQNAIQKFEPTRATMREHGGSDARWFAEQGSNILLMIPQCTAFHIDHEGVNLVSLEKMYNILEDFAVNYYS
jgi:succinyl-diaminopimelate desuccinylase